MRKYRKTSALTSRGLYLRKRIARNRSRAKWVGFLYLLAIIALAAVVCVFPLIKHELASLKVMEFWKVFKPANLKGFKLSNTDLLYKLAVNGLYALMLLGLVINVLRALGKLGWLFKKSANKTYGFNRNVYAMEDLGKIFSGSFTIIVVTYFLIAVMCKDYGGATYQIDKIKLLAVLGGGVVLHILCGIWGASTRYYDFEDGEIIEQTRVVGRFAPFFRNLLQTACVFALMYFYLDVTTLNVTIPELLSKSGFKSFIKDLPKVIELAAQIVVLLCLFVLATHAFATTEYNFDGVHGAGMKNFRVFSFFVFLVAGGAAAYKYLMVKPAVLDKGMLIIAGIAFVMFVIELIMRKMPRFPEDKKKAKKEVEEEFTIDQLSFPEQKVDQSF